MKPKLSGLTYFIVISILIATILALVVYHFMPYKHVPAMANYILHRTADDIAKQCYSVAIVKPTDSFERRNEPASDELAESEWITGGKFEIVKIIDDPEKLIGYNQEITIFEPYKISTDSLEKTILSYDYSPMIDGREYLVLLTRGATEESSQDIYIANFFLGSFDLTTDEKPQWMEEELQSQHMSVRDEIINHYLG